ncbi:acylneuraminate cytidylyltransferase [Microlunatus elymi]|uniref:N-acylneuraminate cytidylyltransferase n=2 Tax=Microlunatus elymi TaxID=2596828 RepID=A0A516Q5V1_9ACTN|nr:acylneuraminate cytidylyltransferase [Microlunatus elymi]
MSTVAIIPARGGSKGVPGKNLRPVGGVPLVARAVRTCLAATSIDDVFVSTDDSAIAEVARRAGAEVIERPAEIAGDTATSESALTHAIAVITERDRQPDVIAFVQCTSPFIDPGDLDRAVELIMTDRADSVLSAIETYEFLWRDADVSLPAGTGQVIGQNHDAAYRPLRQQRRPDFRETGAFYVMRTDGFLAHRHRFFGRTSVVAVSEFGSLEIDTVEQLQLADAICTGEQRQSRALPIDVDAVITDFDGVHTPDTAYIDAHGNELVEVSRSDGLGVERLRHAGLPFLILSKETNPVVLGRATKLGVEVRNAIEDKATALQKWLADIGVPPERAAYLGNDVNDLGPMSVVGWPIAVSDAHPQVLAAAKIVLTAAGGRGAVRELCDRVLASQP